MRARPTLLTALIVLLALPQPTVAQETEQDSLDAVDKIIVRATRRPMDVQDVSGSVTAFDAETMRSANIDNQEDLVFLVPNAVIKGARFNSVSVRGIGTGLTSQGAVALHSNGVFSGPSSFFDVEGVDFVRGPSGSLYGRNATAGAINVQYKKPTPHYEAWGEVDLANYDQVRVRVGANVPLLGEDDDRLALRVNTSFNQHDGWLDNELETRRDDPANADEWGIGGSLRWAPDEDTSVWIRASYAKLRNDVTPSRPLIDRYPVGQLDLSGGTTALAPVGTLRSDPYGGFALLITDLRAGLCNVVLPVCTNPNSPAVDLALNFLALPLIFPDQSVIGQVAQPLSSDRSEVRLSAPLRGDPEIVRWSFDGEIEHSFRGLPLLGDVNVSLRGGVFDTSTHVFIDLDGTELAALDIDRESTTQRWTGEVQLLSENEGPFNWVAGVFFFEDRQSFQQETIVSFANLMEENENREQGLGVFGHAFWDITDALRIEGGVRWSRDSIKADLEKPASGVARPNPIDFQGETVFRERTGDIALHWEWAEDRSVYVKWVRGYRPGGLNIGDGITTADPADVVGKLTFDPEFVNAWEVGTRNVFLDGLLTLNLTAFLYDYKSIQVPVVTVDGIFTSNVGTAENRGVELEARVPLNLLDGGMLFANVGYLHAEYDEFCSDDPFNFQSASDPGCPAKVGPLNALSNIDGNDLPDAPNWTASILVVLNHDLGDWGNLRFMVKSAFRDEYYLRHFNNEEIDLIDSFTRTDARIIWQPNENWSVHLYAENIEGDFTFASTLVGPEITGGLPIGLAIPLSPRIYGVQFEYRWSSGD